MFTIKAFLFALQNAVELAALLWLFYSLLRWGLSKLELWAARDSADWDPLGDLGYTPPPSGTGDPRPSRYQPADDPQHYNLGGDE